MSNMLVTCQSCQVNHVSVLSVTCHTCWSHVSHWLSIGHVSPMCWSHATGVNRVTSPNCWSCFSHVSITCQLCWWHVNHAIASCWSRLCQSRDWVIICRSRVSHVGHVPITCDGHVPIVSVACQSYVNEALVLPQTRVKHDHVLIVPIMWITCHMLVVSTMCQSCVILDHVMITCR